MVEHRFYKLCRLVPVLLQVVRSMLPHALLHVAGAQLLLEPVFIGPSVQAELPQVLDVPDGCGHLHHVVPQVVFVP